MRAGSMSTPTPLAPYFLGGGADDAAVAAAEVEDDVVFLDLGHLEHLVHHDLVGRHVDDTAGKLVFLILILAHCRQRQAQHGAEQEADKCAHGNPPEKRAKKRSRRVARR